MMPVESVTNTTAGAGGLYASQRTVPVTTSPTLLLSSNLRRSSATIQNDSDTVIYITLGRSAAVNSGKRLNANGGSYEINQTNPWYGEVWAISSATKNCLVEEVSA